VPSGYTGVSALNFTSPIFGNTETALDGTNAANQQSFNNISLGATLSSGKYLVLYWSDPDHPGADHGMAIENLQVNFTPVPEPVYCITLTAAIVVIVRLSSGRRFV
jgi:hypothetical protein